MKRSKFFRCLFGAALAALLLPSCGRDTASDAEAVLETIRTRTSVRAYADRPVGADTVEMLLRAAMAAPSARNRQPWAFVVVDDKALLRELADSLPYAKMTASAPLAIVVCGDMTLGENAAGRDWWVQDASAATENLLLAAHALGLGAVWTGAYPYPDRVRAVRNVLRLPGSIIPLNVIPVGYPGEQPAPKQKWDPEKVRYNGWKR